MLILHSRLKKRNDDLRVETENRINSAIKREKKRTHTSRIEPEWKGIAFQQHAAVRRVACPIYWASNSHQLQFQTIFFFYIKRPIPPELCRISIAHILKCSAPLEIQEVMKLQVGRKITRNNSLYLCRKRVHSIFCHRLGRPSEKRWM